MSFISTLRLFLIDVVSITKANCAQPMNYYDSMVVVLVGTKIVLLLLLLGPWLWSRVRNSSFGVMERMRMRSVRARMSKIESDMKGRRRASVAHALQLSLAGVERDISSIDWMKVFHASFMVLFVSYPGTVVVSLLFVQSRRDYDRSLLPSASSAGRRVVENHAHVPVRGD